MSVVTNNIQLGSSVTATQNFTITAEAANGTMKLARGNAGATTQDIFTVDASGNITPGGNILAGVLGVGQTWQDVTASRAGSTTYTNSTGKPIYISVTILDATSASTITVGGVVAAYTDINASASFVTMNVIVPPAASYSVLAAGGVTKWVELR